MLSPETTHDFVFYRGTNEDDLNHCTVFKCTSYDRRIAEGRRKGVFLVITVKIGTRCMFLGHGGMTNEKEIILPPGNFEVTRTDGNIKYVTFTNQQTLKLMYFYISLMPPLSY